MKAGSARAILLSILLILGGPVGGWGQESRASSVDEGRLLREAAVHEARGRYDQARETLQEILDARPGSSGALFALERVLRAQGRVGEVLPRADRYLETEPRAAGAHYLKLRVLSETDSSAALEPALRDWIAAEPGSLEPFREGARILEDAYGPERALQFLREGRGAVSDSAALAVELGDLLLRLGREEEGVRAWSRAVGGGGTDVTAILRRLEKLPRSGPVAASLVEALDAGSTTVSHRRAGVDFALEAGLPGRALELAARVVAELSGTARTGFLSDLARNGEENRAPEVTLWAYRQLREMVDDPSEGRALDIRIAGAALAAGDTVLASEAQTRLARALPAGSPERRRVVADLVRVEAASASPDALVRRLEGFRREFPDAPELDGLTAVVASALQRRGEGETAAAVLEGVEGPQSALERAYVLFAQGDVEGGREALVAAVSGLPPGEATEAIQLAALLDALGPGGSALLSRGAVAAHRGDPEGAVRILVDGLRELPPEDRAPLLGQGARFADQAGLDEEAARLRERLLEEYPDRPESAEAALALARWTALQPGGASRAMALLESLILGRPNSPVVPAARRELERLRRGNSEETR